MSPLKRLTNPYRAAFSTYLHRRLFWLLAALYLLNFDRFVLLALMQIHLRLEDVPQIESIVSGLVDPLMQIGFPVVIAVVLMAHVREELADSSCFLVPNYIRPTLRSGSIAFAITIIAISIVPGITDALYTFINRLSYPTPSLLPSAWESYRWCIFDLPGSLIITCTAMTVAAWFASFGTPWITLALAPILWVAFLATRINPWLLYYPLIANYFDARFASLVNKTLLLFSIAVPAVLNIIALLALYRRINKMATLRVTDSTETTTPQSEPTSPLFCHPALPTAWSRLRHLRSAGINLAAPWIVALLLTVILMLIPPLLISSHHPEMQIQISLLMATILPFVAVSLLWAERWPRLAVESLLPASRQQFVTEISAAIAIDLFHFWIAIAIAATLPLLIVPLRQQDAPLFAERLLASGLMQPLAFAAILWSLWFGSWPTLAGLLCLTIAIIAGPLSYSSKQCPLLPVSTIFPLSALIALIGIAFSALSYHRWLRGNWV